MRFVVAVMLAFVGIHGSLLFQEKFQSGDLAGFTKSPTEHIIIYLEKPIITRKIEGRIMSEADGEPLKNVLFEVRESGGSQRIWKAVSNKKGRFQLRGLRPGEYKFKATLDGFQSIVGIIKYDKEAPAKDRPVLHMRIGV